MFNQNSTIVVVAATTATSSRYIFDPSSEEKVKKCGYVGEKQGMNGNGEVCAILCAAHTLEQIANKKEANPAFTANVVLVLPDKAARRVINIMSAAKGLNEEEDIVKAVTYDWMNNDYVVAIQKFVNQYLWLMDEEGVTVSVEQGHHINYWIVEGKGLKDGMNLSVAEGTSKNGKVMVEPWTDNNGTIRVRNVTYTGVVQKHTDKKTGEVSYRLIREANPETNHGKKLAFIQKLQAKTYELLNEIAPKKEAIDFNTIDLDNVEESDAI